MNNFACDVALSGGFWSKLVSHFVQITEIPLFMLEFQAAIVFIAPQTLQDYINNALRDKLSSPLGLGFFGINLDMSFP